MQETGEGIHRVLCAGKVRQAAYVPDAGHAVLIDRLVEDPGVRTVVLTTEEEGVALCCGAWLGGERAVLLMQSSGAGNCINMLAMTAECRFPLLMLVTMRGQWAEFNPWQVPMGQGCDDALRSAGVIVQRADRRDEVVDTVAAALDLAYSSYRAVAVLIGQRAIGAKRFPDGGGMR